LGLLRRAGVFMRLKRKKKSVPNWFGKRSHQGKEESPVICGWLNRKGKNSEGSFQEKTQFDETIWGGLRGGKRGKSSPTSNREMQAFMVDKRGR